MRRSVTWTANGVQAGPREKKARVFELGEQEVAGDPRALGREDDVLAHGPGDGAREARLVSRRAEPRHSGEGHDEGGRRHDADAHESRPAVRSSVAMRPGAVASAPDTREMVERRSANTRALWNEPGDGPRRALTESLKDARLAAFHGAKARERPADRPTRTTSADSSTGTAQGRARTARRPAMEPPGPEATGGAARRRPQCRPTRSLRHVVAAVARAARSTGIIGRERTVFRSPSFVRGGCFTTVSVAN